MHQQAVSRLERPSAGTGRLDALGHDVQLVVKDGAVDDDPEG